MRGPKSLHQCRDTFQFALPPFLVKRFAKTIRPIFGLDLKHNAVEQRQLSRVQALNLAVKPRLLRVCPCRGQRLVHGGGTYAGVTSTQKAFLFREDLPRPTKDGRAAPLRPYRRQGPLARKPQRMPTARPTPWAMFATLPIKPNKQTKNQISIMPTVYGCRKKPEAGSNLPFIHT